MSIPLIDKIVPKNDGFVGLVDAKQIIGDSLLNVLPYSVFPAGLIGGGNVPSGGGAGMVLTKNSSANFDTKWANQKNSIGVYNYFDYAGITTSNNNNDLTTSIQNFLLWCQLQALAIRPQSSIPGLSQRLKVKAILPWNYYRVTCPIVVPEFVDFVTYGVMVRDGTTGTITNNYTGDTTTKALANWVQPTVIIVPHAHATETVNILCNSNTTGLDRGSGLMVGKNWTQDILSVGATNPVVTAGGSAYTVNDILTCAQPSDPPYVASTYRVTSVNGSGAITGVVIVEQGAYALPPVLQAQQWTTANGFNVFDVNGNIRVTGGTGTGASIAPNWLVDFPDTSSNFLYYNGGRGGLIGDTIIGHINPVQSNFKTASVDAIYGQIFLLKLYGLNFVIDEIEGLFGYYGLWLENVSDCRFTTINTVKSMCLLRLFRCASFECPNIVVDTPFSSAPAYFIDDCQGIILKNGYGFFRDVANNTGYVYPIVTVGAFSTGTSFGMNIELDMYGLGAGGTDDAHIPYIGCPAWRLGAVHASNFNSNINNDSTSFGGAFRVISQFAELHDDIVSCTLSGSINGTYGTLFDIQTSNGKIPPGLGIDIWDSDVSIVNGSITATIGGTKTTGDKIVINFTNVHLTANYVWPRRPSYTILGGDTLTTIAAGVVAAINADAALSINGVFASNIGAIITIVQMGCWANSTTLTATITGAATETVVFSNSGAVSGSIAGGKVGSGGLYDLYGEGVPTNGAHGTGWNKAPKGSRYMNTLTGTQYINQGTAASVNWV